MTQLEEIKKYVAANAEKTTEISDKVWEYTELPFEETKSAELFKKELEAEGFEIEDGLAGIPTAFLAKYVIGSGKPVFGLLAGRCLIKCTDKERLYRRVLAVTLPLTLFYCWLAAKKGFTPLSDGLYYWHSLADGFFFICLDLMLIAIAWQLCKILPQWIIRPLEGLSKNITAVYCISWVIICWVGIPLFMGLELQPLNPWVAYIPALAITAISYWLALKWIARKTSLRK